MVTVDEIVSAIKSKKELTGLDDDFVQDKVEKILSGNNKLRQKMTESKSFDQFSRSKEYKDLLKTIRKNLRTIYGVFQEEDKTELLTAVAKEDDPDRRQMLLGDLLRSHTSTKERLADYFVIYKKLAEMIPAPNVVIDLGCGLNPLSHHYMERHSWAPRWIASDISQNDMNFLKTCFTTLDIPGETIRLDLTKEYEKLKELQGDVTFLLKLLDSLEEIDRHISYKIIENIITPWIVVSFPTKSLGGKKTIAKSGRTWFERLLERKELEWETFSTENELFYVIRNGIAR